MLLPKHNHILRTPTKKKTQRKNPKRSEIEKRKTLGHIMKFQNLKLEKELERQRNLRNKNESIEKKERVPSARWAMNGVDNGLRLLESDYLHDSGLRFCFSTGL